MSHKLNAAIGAQIECAYLKDELTLKECGKRFGCHKDTIREVLKLRGVARRDGKIRWTRMPPPGFPFLHHRTMAEVMAHERAAEMRSSPPLN